MLYSVHVLWQLGNSIATLDDQYDIIPSCCEPTLYIFRWQKYSVIQIFQVVVGHSQVFILQAHFGTDDSQIWDMLLINVLCTSHAPTVHYYSYLF